MINDEQLEEELQTATKPYQYIGQEYLSYNKIIDADTTTMVFAFPDKYEVGISNLGVRILYDLINKKEGLMADRTYAPEPDFAEQLEKSGVKLYALESKKPLSEFDFVGFSLQYELSYPTVLKMLELSGITIKRTERKENEPIIVAGGPCCFNPKPMSDFIDLFVIGDGEEANIELMNKYKSLKGLSRAEKIKELAKIKGIYSSELNNKTEKELHS